MKVGATIMVMSAAIATQLPGNVVRDERGGPDSLGHGLIWGETVFQYQEIGQAAYIVAVMMRVKYCWCPSYHHTVMSLKSWG